MSTEKRFHGVAAEIMAFEVPAPDNLPRHDPVKAYQMGARQMRRAAAELACEKDFDFRAGRLLLGDTFTHNRSGVQFVCRSITHADREGKIRTVIELEQMG